MTKKPDDEEFVDIASRVTMEAIELDPIASALREQYERGWSDCRREMLGEILAKVPGISDCVALLRAPAAELGSRPYVMLSDGKPHMVHAGPAAPPAPPSAPQPASRSTQAAPRPKTIPTTFTMARAVLLEEPGLTAKEVSARIEKRWWPGLVFNQIGPEFYAFVASGRMTRDDSGRLSLTDRGLVSGTVDNRLRTNGTQPPQPRAMVPDPLSVPPVVEPKSPAVTIADKVSVTRVADAGLAGGGDAKTAVKFEHAGRSVMLPSREHAVVSKLGVNAGWLPFPILFGAAFRSTERHHSDAEVWLREVEPSINGKLKLVGLQMRLVPKMGYALMESST